MVRIKTSHVVIAALGIALGWGGATFWLHRATSEQRVMESRQCPMHPWVKSTSPGTCPVCGMELVAPGSVGAAGVKAVVLSPESVRATGVHTVAIQRQPLIRTLRFTGKFEEDMTTHAVISAPVEGRIDGLGLVHGNGKVVQRQPLATMFSRTLLAVAGEYKAALDHDEAAAAVARRKLEHYGLVWEQIKAIPLRQDDDLYFGLLSPRTGSVVKSYVVEGQTVREGETLFEITDLAKLWFVFPAFEQDLPWLETGQIVDISAASAADLKIKARITMIGRHFDEVTHTAPVRVELENPTGRLGLNAVGMATVNLSAPEVLAVPRAAILWPGAGPRVYVEKSPGIYEPRALRLGRGGDSAWEALSGVGEGERVVSEAAMLIDGGAQLSGAGQ